MTGTTTTSSIAKKLAVPPQRVTTVHSSGNCSASERSRGQTTNCKGSGGKHQHFYRRVMSRRLNLLAREHTMVHYQFNPTNVWPRCVRFANRQPSIIPNSSSCSCSAVPVGASRAASSSSNSCDQCCWKDDRDHLAGSSSSSNNDPGCCCWYSQKDFNRILAENQCILEIARTLLDQHGCVDEASLPFLQGLECFLSPEQAERRQRQVADHARRVLESLNSCT